MGDCPHSGQRAGCLFTGNHRGLRPGQGMKGQQGIGNRSSQNKSAAVFTIPQQGYGEILATIITTGQPLMRLLRLLPNHLNKLRGKRRLTFGPQQQITSLRIQPVYGADIPLKIEGNPVCLQGTG